MQLSVAGEWQDISATISQIPVSGSINGGDVEGVIVGVLSPVASRGVVVIVLSNAGSWQASSGQAALTLARSLRFAKKNNTQAIGRLQQLLRGKSLTYSHNYTSSGGGGYVSSSTEAELHLCSNGHFQGRYQSMASVDAGGTSAFSGDDGPQSASGQWRVSDYLGEVVLELRPEGQAPVYFPVALSGGKLMLGGKGFRISAGQQCR